MGGWPSAAWLCTARGRQQEQINTGKPPSYIYPTSFLDTAAMTAVLYLTAQSRVKPVLGLRPPSSASSQTNVSTYIFRSFSNSCNMPNPQFRIVENKFQTRICFVRER